MKWYFYSVLVIFFQKDTGMKINRYFVNDITHIEINVLSRIDTQFLSGALVKGVEDSFKLCSICRRQLKSSQWPDVPIAFKNVYMIIAVIVEFFRFWT